MDTETFAAVFAALYAAHMVADHWVQTERQARAKGERGWPGRIACATHVLTYTATAVIALALTVGFAGVHLQPDDVAYGLAVSAITHYIADRRTPLQKLARWAGHSEFYQMGRRPPGDPQQCLGTGAYALDQSWHIGWLFIAALVIA